MSCCNKMHGVCPEWAHAGSGVLADKHEYGAALKHLVRKPGTNCAGLKSKNLDHVTAVRWSMDLEEEQQGRFAKVSLLLLGPVVLVALLILAMYCCCGPVEKDEWMKDY